MTTLENVSPNDLSKVTIPGTLSDAGSTDTAQQETASLRDDSLDSAESTEDPIDGMAAVTFAREDDCASFGICLLMIMSKIMADRRALRSLIQHRLPRTPISNRSTAKSRLSTLETIASRR